MENQRSKSRNWGILPKVVFENQYNKTRKRNEV
jgi:hypothetical protein